jgi:hypothetical protein
MGHVCAALCGSLTRRRKAEFEDHGGGIGYVEMLYRTNYVALVGGGPQPRFPPTDAVVWDDVKRAPAITLHFKSDVRAVKLRRDRSARRTLWWWWRWPWHPYVQGGCGTCRIVVVLSTKVVLYGFTNPPQRLSVFDTCENDAGMRRRRTIVPCLLTDGAPLLPLHTLQASVRCALALQTPCWPFPPKHRATYMWWTLVPHASFPA